MLIVLIVPLTTLKIVLIVHLTIYIFSSRYGSIGPPTRSSANIGPRGRSEARIAPRASASEPEVQCGLRTDLSRSNVSHWTEGRA